MQSKTVNYNYLKYVYLKLKSGKLFIVYMLINLIEKYCICDRCHGKRVCNFKKYI